jgi:UDP:flavonoid glycosyltransferase YjiC (YdhE family)
VRVLFLAEAVTWSQVVRLMVLARGLGREFEVHFASARFDERLFENTYFKRWPIFSLAPDKVEAAVAGGRRIYSKPILKKYVQDELRLIDAVKPDVIVSDLRWSTCISGPVSGVPVCTLIDAYWSRRMLREAFPVPDHPIVKLLGVPMAQKYFPVAQPKVFQHFVAPVNELRRAYGLGPIGDLFDVINWGDRVLFPDDPRITPLSSVAPHETFLGPILWSPRVNLPSWWYSLEKPFVYATLGSSGALQAAPAVIEALGSMDVDVVLSTAARFVPRNVPPNIRVVDMIPGDVAARRAKVVVCNGGASTGYQALAECTPIVGIPSNLDQFLAMTAIRDAGGGVMLRASTVTPEQVRNAVTEAMRLRIDFKPTLDPHARFRAVLSEIAGDRAAAHSPPQSPLRARSRPLA